MKIKFLGISLGLLFAMPIATTSGQHAIKKLARSAANHSKTENSARYRKRHDARLATKQLHRSKHKSKLQCARECNYRVAQGVMLLLGAAIATKAFFLVQNVLHQDSAVNT